MRNLFKLYKGKNSDGRVYFSFENLDNPDFISGTFNEDKDFYIGEVIYKIINNHNVCYLTSKDKKIRIFNRMTILLPITKDESNPMKPIYDK